MDALNPAPHQLSRSNWPLWVMISFVVGVCIGIGMSAAALAMAKQEVSTVPKSSDLSQPAPEPKAAPAGEPQELIGFPSRRAHVLRDGGEAKSVILSGSEAAEAVLQITRVGNEYRYTSRNGRNLLRFQAGSYDLFVEPTTGTVIKTHGSLLSKLGPPENNIDYVEILPTKLDVLMYHGRLQSRVD